MVFVLIKVFTVKRITLKCFQNYTYLVSVLHNFQHQIRCFVFQEPKIKYLYKFKKNLIIFAHLIFAIFFYFILRFWHLGASLTDTDTLLIHNDSSLVETFKSELYSQQHLHCKRIHNYNLTRKHQKTLRCPRVYFKSPHITKA